MLSPKAMRHRNGTYSSCNSAHATIPFRRKSRKAVWYKGASAGHRFCSNLSVIFMIWLWLVCGSTARTEQQGSNGKISPIALLSQHRRAQQLRRTTTKKAVTASTMDGRRDHEDGDEGDYPSEDDQTDSEETEDDFVGDDELDMESIEDAVDKVDVPPKNNSTADIAPGSAKAGNDANSGSSSNLSKQLETGGRSSPTAVAGTSLTTPAVPAVQNDTVVGASAPTTSPVTLAPIVLPTSAAPVPTPTAAIPAVPKVATPAPRSIRMATPAPRAMPTLQPVKKLAPKEEEIHGGDINRPLADSPAAISFEVLAALLGVAAMIFTAWQMSDNPDGLFASMCRLIITCIQLVYRIVTSPCRKCMPCCFSSHHHAGNGYHEPYGHMRVSTMDYGYKDPALELS